MLVLYRKKQSITMGVNLWNKENTNQKDSSHPRYYFPPNQTEVQNKLIYFNPVTFSIDNRLMVLITVQHLWCMIRMTLYRNRS